MRYQVTLAVETPSKHYEDISINHSIFHTGTVEEFYPNFTQDEFILEMVKRLSEAYRTGEDFVYLGGMIDGEWFSIEQDINERVLCVRGYDSKYDFDNGDENDMGGKISLYKTRKPVELTDEQIKAQAKFAIDLLGIELEDGSNVNHIPPLDSIYLGIDDEPTSSDELNILSSLGK